MLVAGLTAVVATSFGLDFETSGETLDSLFAKLSKETGMTLRVNADVANEVVIIKARNVEPLTLLKKIGDATGLTWTQEEGGYRLSKHFAEEQKAAADYRAYTYEGWQSWKADPAVSQSSPIDEIMMEFQPEQISNMTIGGRLVFSDRPNRNQIAMTTNVRSAATKLVYDRHQERIDAMETQYNQRPNDRFRAMIDAQKAPPVKVIMVVRRQSLNAFSINLQGLDSDGNARYNYGGVYVLSSPDTDSSAVASWKFDENSPARNNLKLLTSSSSNSLGTDPSALREIIMDPVRNEPFAFAIGPALIESAPENQNFVACLPDESFDRIATGISSRGAAGIAGTGVLINKDADGWVIFTPQLKVHNWDTRRDRKALVPLIRKLAASGILSINDQADYAKSVTTWFSATSWEYNIARRTLGAAASRELAKISGSQIEGLAIYNALRAKLNGQDEVLPLTALTQNFVNFTVFNSPADPRILQQVQVDSTARLMSPGGPTQGIQQINLSVIPVVEYQMQRGGPGQSEVQFRRAGERTELYSGGLPATGQIIVDFNTRDSYVVRSTDGTNQSIMSERDLTMFRASQLSSNIRMRDGGLSATNNVFGATKSTSITFDLQFTDGTAFSRSVSGTDAPSQYAQYGNLSPNLLSRIEKSATELATRANQQTDRNDQRRPGGRRGGGTPPPQ